LSLLTTQKMNSFSLDGGETKVRCALMFFQQWLHLKFSIQGFVQKCGIKLKRRELEKGIIQT